MTFLLLLAKMRSALTRHGLLAPARLSVLKESDIPTLVEMALPGEEIDDDSRKDLILWLNVQLEDARRETQLQTQTDAGTWKERCFLAHREALQGSRDLRVVQAEHAVGRTFFWVATFQVRRPKRGGRQHATDTVHVVKPCRVHQGRESEIHILRSLPLLCDRVVEFCGVKSFIC